MPYRSCFAPDLFKGQTIIVTGGGSGLGRCTAHEIAALGANVVITGRTADKLETVRGEIVADGGACACRVFDIRDDEAVQAHVAAITAEFGRIDGLVNNAGGQFHSKLEDISANGFDAVVRTNLTGGFLMMRAVYKASMAEHGGSIVNITADTVGGLPGMAHSGAARAGMDNLTTSAAWEWGRNGVRVNSVAPGWIRSSGLETYPDEDRKRIFEYWKMTPLQRLGAEYEVSAAVVFLLSPASSFVSGSVLRVDGGKAGSAPHAISPLPERKQARPLPENRFHRSNDPRG